MHKYSANNLDKYNSPMVNENIMCNNYINLNFNNCSNFSNQTNKKNDKIIDVSTIKKILSNHIEANNNMNNMYNNDNNYSNINNKNDNNYSNINNKNENNNSNLNSKNDNNANTISVTKKKDKIFVNKSSYSKYTLSKSSSMKIMSGYHNNYFNENKSPILIKSNNDNDSSNVNYI